MIALSSSGQVYTGKFRYSESLLRSVDFHDLESLSKQEYFTGTVTIKSRAIAVN